MINLSEYQITTALPKPNSKVARTFQPGEDLTPINPFVGVGRLYAPTTGASTESVKRTRCEIVGKPFTFDSADEHLSLMTWHLGAINWFGKTVFQQMHCDDGNDPTLKMFALSNDGGKTGRISIGLRETDSAADPGSDVLLNGVDFTLPVLTSIHIERIGLVTVEAVQGANYGRIRAQLSPGRAARPHVFHWGPYNQVNMGLAGEPPNDGTLLYWSDITELHNKALPKSEELQQKIDKTFAAWESGTLPRLDALVALNAISKEVAEINDSKERAPLYASIKYFKAIIN